MSDGAEIIKLVHDAKPESPQCPHCKYFVPGTLRDQGGRCKITMMSVKLEREDYDEDQSCGPEARWFKPRDEGDEPVAVAAEVEEARRTWYSRFSLVIALFIGIAIAQVVAGVMK